MSRTAPTFFQKSSSTYAFLFCAATEKKRFSTYFAKVTSSCEEEEKRGGACVDLQTFHHYLHVLPHLIRRSSRVAKDFVEDVEDRQLEDQGVHFEVDSQAVQHASDAVVCVGRVFGVRL